MISSDLVQVRTLPVNVGIPRDQLIGRECPIMGLGNSVTSVIARHCVEIAALRDAQVCSRPRKLRTVSRQVIALHEMKRCHLLRLAYGSASVVLPDGISGLTGRCSSYGSRHSGRIVLRRPWQGINRWRSDWIFCNFASIDWLLE